MCVCVCNSLLCVLRIKDYNFNRYITLLIHLVNILNWGLKCADENPYLFNNNNK